MADSKKMDIKRITFTQTIEIEVEEYSPYEACDYELDRKFKLKQQPGVMFQHKKLGEPGNYSVAKEMVATILFEGRPRFRLICPAHEACPTRSECKGCPFNNYFIIEEIIKTD